MVSVRDRSQRIVESRLKIHASLPLDESLCLYCPQDNVDALQHPRVRDWFDFVSDRYRPELPDGTRHVLLMMPCTKTKPYTLSLEHLRINAALRQAGFAPAAKSVPPNSLAASVPPEFAPDLIDLGPLRSRGGVVVHRAVISEPLGFVPYEHILHYEGKESPACAYDDPGLFENRGNAVSPWREDCTATAVSGTQWRWGDAERRGYVVMHNAMAEMVARVIRRIGGLYDLRIAWVAPGLTHRSFVVAADERRAHGIAGAKRIGAVNMKLTGANDLLPPDNRILALPTLDQCSRARQLLAEQLGCDIARVGGEYSRGGGGATPLALPEMLTFLVEALGAKPRAQPAA